MKKKKKWVLSLFLAFLVAGILFLYNAMNGNPASKFFSKTALKTYLAETYPDKEFTIRNGFYNFKDSGYSFDVIQIGDEQQKEYEFTVNGFFKPEVRYDGIYYASLDTPLIEKLEQEAEAEMFARLADKESNLANVDVQLEVLEGTYGSDTKWNKHLKLEKPMYVHIVVDAGGMDKKEMLESAVAIQQAMNDEGYIYGRATINGNNMEEAEEMDQDHFGYVKYSVSFTKNDKIKESQIEVLEE
ncbi:MAG TPA: hypothetical protein VIG80_15130 [Bacillaceae bacterium]